MFRVTAVYDVPKYKRANQQRVMIVKTLPFGDGAKAEMFKNSFNIFKIETKMYTQVLPEMERLLSAAGDDTKICPKLLYQTSDPAPTIILEDISQDGFEMILKPPGYEGTLKIASMLAKFHATSMFLQKSGTNLTSFSEALLFGPVPNSDLVFVEAVIMPVLSQVLDELKSWPDNDVVVEKFEKTIPKFVNQLKAVYFGKNDQIYSVLNHCDFHFKNIMVRNSSQGLIDDLILLDYQCCLWGTPAIDLSYLLFSMANTEARERRNEIIQYYYDEFSSTLKKIGYLGNIPSLLDLNLEILKNSAIEILHIFCMVIFQFMDFTEVTADELFDMKKDQSLMQRKLMKLPQYQEILKRELPRLIATGIIG
uniref:CSON009904 protein n=1 Tax=Culicoides sonorensis TaxID=179676 RepID=A0A336M4W5_CULSO